VLGSTARAATVASWPNIGVVLDRLDGRTPKMDVRGGSVQSTRRTSAQEDLNDALSRTRRPASLRRAFSDVRSQPLQGADDRLRRAAGVPFASILVPLSGLLAIAGGLSVLIGWHARAGAWLLVAFLVPVTLMMHAFWRIPDTMMRQIQMAMFMKNLAMLGGAFLIAYWGAGPVSLDERAEQPVRQATVARATAA